MAIKILTIQSVANRGLMVATTLLAVGCASAEMPDDPTARRLSWISYLSGEDLRQDCHKEGLERYRLVFNADDNQHIRTYDVTGDPGDGSANLQTRIIAAADLSRVNAADPIASVHGQTAQTRLAPEQFGAFMLALSESGAFEAIPERLRLPSGGILWLVSGCHKGRWFFSAFPQPANRYVDARFLAPLRKISRPLPLPASTPLK